MSNIERLTSGLKLSLTLTVNILTIFIMKTITIPDDILQAARMSDKELKQEIAIMLFQKEKLTLSQAARLAEMEQFSFQHLLASRQIPIHYDIDEFDDDVDTLKSMGRL